MAPLPEKGEGAEGNQGNAAERCRPGGFGCRGPAVLLEVRQNAR